jgi:DNA invertase Pin-like site-specific DNA recombinase
MHGVKVLSYVEGMHDSAPHSVLMRQFIDANAQFERANGRKRINDCLRFAAKKGYWKGGTPSFGYTYQKGSRELVQDERESAIVKYIFEQVAAGVTVPELLGELRRLKLYGRVSRASSPENVS